MALYTVQGSENIPKDVVRLSRTEAIEYQKEIVRDWKNPLDVIFLRNGKFLVSGLACASAYPIIQHLRKVFELGNRHLLIAYYPVFMVAPLLGFGFEKNITNNVLLMEMKCPLCWQMKYSLQQATAGVVYPFVLGSISCAFSASLLKTVPVPDLVSQPKQYLQMISKIYKNNALKLNILLSFHLLSAFFWPYMQNIELNNIRKTMREEEKILNEQL